LTQTEGLAVDARHIRGQDGETAAATALQEAGYRIVERNLKTGGVEVDLLALDGDVLVFVEVRTRGSDAFGTPGESVTGHKARRIARAASAYLKRHKAPRGGVRCDVVSVRPASEGSAQVEIIPDAVDLTAALDHGQWRR